MNGLVKISITIKEIFGIIKESFLHLRSILKWFFVGNRIKTFVFGIIVGFLIMILINIDRESLWLMVKSKFLNDLEFYQEKSNILYRKVWTKEAKLKDIKTKASEYRIKELMLKIEENKKSGFPTDDLQEQLLFEKRNWYELHGKSLSWELEQEFEKFYREQELGWKDYKKEKRCELILAQSSISPPLKRPNLELKSKKDLLSVQLSFKGMVARTVCKEIIKSFKVETGKIEEKVINEEQRNLTSSDILSMGGVFRFAGVYFIPFSNKYIPSGDFVVRNFQILDSDENLFKVDIPPLNKGELLIGVIIMDNFQTIFPQLFSKDFFISSMVSPPTIEISEISFKEFFNNPQFPGVVTLSCLRDRYNIPLETLNIYMASMLGKYPTRLLTENIIVISIESTKLDIAEFISCQ